MPKRIESDLMLFGDTLEIMDTLPDSSIDCVICDLPYGTTKNKWDEVIPFKHLWRRYDRIVKPTGNIILFGQELFLVDLINSNRSDFRYTLCWDKLLSSGFLNSKKMPLRVHESIAVFYKKPGVYNPQMMEGKPNNSKGTKFKTKEVVNNNYGNYNPTENIETNLKYPKSIVSFQKPHPSKSIHPTEKPLDLINWLVKTYSNEGDLILDNTSGSGVLAESCLLNNRKFICIENNEDYYNIALNRIYKDNNGTK